MPADATIQLPPNSGGPILDAEAYTNDESTATNRERIAVCPGAPTAGQTSIANVAVSNSGNTALVASQTSQSIRVMRILMTVASPTNIEFLDGASTVILGPYVFQSNGSLVLDDDGEPWFVGSDGNALNINLSAASTVQCTVWYTQS